MDISHLLAGGGGKSKNKKKKNPPADAPPKKEDTTAEEDVLASLGTTRAETSSYETEVLRQATHRLAPNLRVDVANPKDPDLGFPDFITETSLLPFSSAKQGKANRQVVLIVLKQVQEQMKNVALQESQLDKMRLLAMKQNILLSMLGQHSKRPEIQQAWKESNTTLQLYEQYEKFNPRRRKRVSMQERKGLTPGSNSLAKAKQQLRKKKRVWKDWSSDEEDNSLPKTRPVLAEMNYSRRRMGMKSSTKTTGKRNSLTRARGKRQKRRNSKTSTSSKEDATIVIDEEDEKVKQQQMGFDLRNASSSDEGRPKRQNRTKVTSYAENDAIKEEELEEEEQEEEEQEENSNQKDEMETTRSADDLHTAATDDATTRERPKRRIRTQVTSYAYDDETETETEEEEEGNNSVEPVGDNNKGDGSERGSGSGSGSEGEQPAPVTSALALAEADSITTTNTSDDTTKQQQATQTPHTTANTAVIKEEEQEEDEDRKEPLARAAAATAVESMDSQSMPEGGTKDESGTPPATMSQPPQQQQQQQDVICPLCQKPIPDIPAGADPSLIDSRLAEHMAQCQQQQGASRSRRSSGRKRTSPSSGSYKEDDDIDADGGEVLSTRGSKRRRSKTTTSPDGTPLETIADTDADEKKDEEEHQSNIKTKHDDDQFAFDADMDDNEDEDVDLEVDDDEEDEEIPLEKPTAVDDYLLDDYEDRVDYWRLHGVSEMRDMSKLRAEGEIDQGARLLDGQLQIPAWMNNRLFGYQRTGLEWMWTLHQQQAGGVMGDEMGLGKTVQVSSFLGAMAASRQLKGVLVISPATMLQHWLSELAVWAPGLRRVLLHSSGDSGSSLETPRNLVNQGPAIFRNLRDWLKAARKERLHEKIESSDGADVDEEPDDSFCGTGYAIVTTYEHVRRHQDDYVNHPWSYVVMDEAQKIRNPTADITLACKRLRTPHRIAMTGTPIQNDLKELWSLFDFVFPGRLGTLPAFEEEFAAPIKRGGYSNASPVQVQLAYRCSLVLRDLIDPYLLRRQKAEIDEVRRMPSKTEHVLFCRLSKRQRSMYEAFLKSDMVKKIFQGSTLLFAAVTMLRKICNHPDLVLPDSSQGALEAFLRNGCVPEEQLMNSDEEEEDCEDDYDPFVDAGDRLEERSGKFEVMAKILPLWKKQGHRVLIFSQWTKMLNIIQTFVIAQGWKFLRLDGKTSVASRQQLVDKFNSDQSYFGMLCTTRTGGVGLNLTGANKLILYDVDWNPQTDAQARERAWRFGQEKQVTVYRLCTAGTIEEKMYQRQIFKTALTNKVLHDPRQKRLFSQKDLHDLLTLQPDSGKANSRGNETIETTDRLVQASRKSEGDGRVDASEVSKDDGETLASVLKSKGLAGVFDHNFVDPSGAAGNKSQSAREMEEQAKQIAKEASEALRSSVDSDEEDDPFTPTWTGAPESRFGGGGGNGGSKRRGSGSGFGSASTAGTFGSGGSKSSGSLLASIRQQNKAVKSG